MARKASSTTESTANPGFEQKLWVAADRLRISRFLALDKVRRPQVDQGKQRFPMGLNS